MRAKFLITESDKRNILKMYGLLTEEISVYEGGTSGENISHKKLNTEWGLPYTGIEDEKKYYQASMKDVLEKSVGLPKEQKLSMFQPTGSKSDNHFLAMLNNQILTTDNQGKKSLKWEKVTTGQKEFYLSGDGFVAGAGNGLLAFARAISKMTKSNPAKFLINIGTPVGKEGEKERYSSGIVMETACDLTIPMNRVMDALVLLSVDPYWRSFVNASLGNTDINNDEALKDVVKNSISYISRGDNLFIPPISGDYSEQQRNQQILAANLKPLTDYNLDSLFNELSNLRSINEFDAELMKSKSEKGGYAPGQGFQEKIQKMNQISGSKIEDLNKNLQQRYYENMDKWIKTVYKGKSTIKPCMPQIRNRSLGEYEKDMLTRRGFVKTVPTTPKMKTGYEKHKIGQ